MSADPACRTEQTQQRVRARQWKEKLWNADGHAAKQEQRGSRQLFRGQRIVDVAIGLSFFEPIAKPAEHTGQVCIQSSLDVRGEFFALEDRLHHDPRGVDGIRFEEVVTAGDRVSDPIDRPRMGAVHIGIDPANHLFDDLFENRVLAREVVVEKAVAEPRSGGDVADLGPRQSLFGEDSRCRANDAFASMGSNLFVLLR